MIELVSNASVATMPASLPVEGMRRVGRSGSQWTEDPKSQQAGKRTRALRGGGGLHPHRFGVAALLLPVAGGCCSESRLSSRVMTDCHRAASWGLVAQHGLYERWAPAPLFCSKQCAGLDRIRAVGFIAG
jgi:hypothetical protein